MASWKGRPGAGPTEAYLAVDGSGWHPALSPALEPLSPRLLSFDPWPPIPGESDPPRRLAWLSGAFRDRPLLGVTRRRLSGVDGVPIRGLSDLGSGVAIVSLEGLDADSLRGVIRHELAHALGMGHCPLPSCALSERPWPMSLEDRPAAFCPSCRVEWDGKTGGAAP